MNKNSSEENSLPVIEGDSIVKINSKKKQIELGSTIVGEINSFSSSDIEGELEVFWYSSFDKSRLKSDEVFTLENKIEKGVPICSLFENKFGVCIDTTTYANCVILGGENWSDNEDKKYLLNVNVDRLQSLTKLESCLCYINDSLYELDDTFYIIKLNYKDKFVFKCKLTKRLYESKFQIINDQFYKKPITTDNKFDRIPPYSFNEILGKIVKIKKEDFTNLVFMDKTDELLKEFNSIESKNKYLKFTVVGLSIESIVLTLLKDFIQREEDEVKTKIVKKEEFSKVKFLNLYDRQVDVASRWKLNLNKKTDTALNLKEYQNIMNVEIKDKISSCPKLKDLKLDNYTVKINDFYESKKKKCSSSKDYQDLELSDSDASLDDVFADTNTVENPITDNKFSNMFMLTLRNLRNRNSTSRTNSLSKLSERRVNSSFKKIKLLDSSSEEIDKNSKKNQTDQTDNQVEKENLVLVDVLYTNTFLEILWQDGTIEKNVPLSHVIEEIDNIIPKFHPGNFVYINSSKEESKNYIPHYGIVQKVTKDNIAEVKWFGEFVNKNEINNNEKKSVELETTFESVFNLEPYYVSYNVGDVIVDQDLIISASKISVEKITSYIGVIKRIYKDGTGLCEWLDGNTNKKKLLELVNFFDIEMAGDNELTSDSDGSFHFKDDSEWELSSNNSSEKIKDVNFYDEFKFNKYKMKKHTMEEQLISLDKFLEFWSFKLDKIKEILVEYKETQNHQLNAISLAKNHKGLEIDSLKEKIFNSSFQLIENYLDEFKKKVADDDKKTENLEEIKNLNSLLVDGFNKWLDFLQCNFSFIYSFLEKETIDVSAKNESDVKNMPFLNEYKKKIIVLINRFNNEVVKQTYSSSEESISSVSDKSIDNYSEELFSYKKIECISLEKDNIKHSYLKNSNLTQCISKINLNALQKDLGLLENSLPDGIYVRTFEERLDLFSIMIEGSIGTPYANNLFLFDLKIEKDYPNEPPQCFYISFCKQQINPNLYLDGNVCLSLLNTFFGKIEQEKWQSNKSNILQLCISLQALVLNAHPYFNEADFDAYINTEQEHSIELFKKSDTTAFKDEIKDYYKKKAYIIYENLYKILMVSIKWNKQCTSESFKSEIDKQKSFSEYVENNYPEMDLPIYQLLPGTEGFCLSLAKNLNLFYKVFEEHLPKDIEDKIKNVQDFITSTQI